MGSCNSAFIAFGTCRKKLSAIEIDGPNGAQFESRFNAEFAIENSQQTLKIGRLAAFVGIPLLIYFTIQDIYILHFENLFLWRAIGIAPLIAFLVLSYTVLERRSKAVIFFHALSLLGIMIMTVGMNIEFFSMKSSSTVDKMGVTGALIVNIFAVFIFSSGARKYLIFIISFPLLLLFLHFFINHTLAIGDATHFSNPLVVAICAIFLSFVQEKIHFQEFKMRKLALWKEEELELQVQKDNSLNRELNEVLRKLEIDNAKRKQVEEKLRQREDAVRALINANTESTLLIDIQGNILAMNDVAAERLQIASPETVGLNIFNQLPPEVSQFRRDKIDEVLSTGRPIQFEDQRYGRTIQNSIFPVFDEKGKVIELAIFGLDISEQKQLLEEKETLIKQLQHALDEIRQLSGLLPICASCKKISDDKGYWEQIETYVQKRSGVAFSHGICPDCLKNLYPEHADEILAKNDHD